MRLCSARWNRRTCASSLKDACALAAACKRWRCALLSVAHDDGQSCCASLRSACSQAVSAPSHSSAPAPRCFAPTRSTSPPAARHRYRPSAAGPSLRAAACCTAQVAPPRRRRDGRAETGTGEARGSHARHTIEAYSRERGAASALGWIVAPNRQRARSQRASAAGPPRDSEAARTHRRQSHRSARRVLDARRSGTVSVSPAASVLMRCASA